MARTLYIPEGYESKLSLRETQHAIKYIKDLFQQALSFGLTLDRVTAPLIVQKGSGINDDLNGIERKVEFSIKEIENDAEVVQSLAKWKRMALYRYKYNAGEGIYTDMNAIRRDDDTDNVHSIFVDQWDWEKVIHREERTVEFLKESVTAIVKAIAFTKRKVNLRYPVLKTTICDTPFFIMQIGGNLKSGQPHDGRAPDYDDWSLNGDLLFWDEVLDNALEISSMGIRVDAESLQAQLAARGAEDRYQYTYHQMIRDNVLPLTIGGGIGQSRLCMLLLEKAHIGEVQASIWPASMLEECAAHGITLL